jgi:hypothetical protein
VAPAWLNGSSTSTATRKAAAKALDTGRTGVDAGPVTPVEMESWSWRDAEELEPGYWDVAETEVKPWQPYTAKEAARLVALIVADWAEPDGAGGLDQVTTGESEFLLLRNGEATSPPFIATVASDEPRRPDGSDDVRHRLHPR